MEDNYREVKKAEPCLKLIHMDQVEVEEIEWLFYPFIPYGKVTIIQGDPGEGKTTVVLQIIAKLTKGEGKLHIQVRFSDILNTDNHGYVYLKNEDGKVVNCQSSVAFWDQSHVNSYEEFVFEVSAEELVNYEIWGEFWTCNNAPIEGEWQVTFPVEKNE